MFVYLLSYFRLCASRTPILFADRLFTYSVHTLASESLSTAEIRRPERISAGMTRSFGAACGEAVHLTMSSRWNGKMYMMRWIALSMGIITFT